MIEWKDIPHVTGAQEARVGHLLLRVGYSTGKKDHRATWLVEVAHADGERYLNLALSFEDTPEAAKLAAETFAREWVAKQASALGDGWIPVGERLPEDFDAVVIFAKECDGYTYRGLAIYDAQYGKWIVNGGSGHGLTVSHWLELPPLPVVEVKE